LDEPITDQIEGFASGFSVNHGLTLDFKINANADPGAIVPYRVKIYRLGYYGGARPMLVTMIETNGHAQHDPITDDCSVVDAGNWCQATSASGPAATRKLAHLVACCWVPFGVDWSCSSWVFSVVLLCARHSGS
jgi:hypothetical protein